MIMTSYTERLGKVFSNLNTATLKVSSMGRKYLTAAEDPASSARASQLHRNIQKNNDYLNNTLDVIDTIDTIHQGILVLQDIATNTYTKVLDGLNDVWTNNDRQIMANEIRMMQKSAVDSLNSKFEDGFVFGGSSTKELPFELSADGQTLTFRGLDVTDPANQAELKRLAGEKIYRDLGFGLDVTDNNGKLEIKDSSAFNTAHPGISFIGFGEDPTDNLVLNLGKIASALETEPFDEEAVRSYMPKLKEQSQQILNAVTRVHSSATFLQQRVSVLERINDNLNSKILNVEYMDMEEAINLFKMHDYTYRAALEMGARILTPSFIDFMK